jgi:hypothetical protein
MVFLGWSCHLPTVILIEHGLELSHELGRDLSRYYIPLPSHFLNKLQSRYSSLPQPKLYILLI